MREPVWSHPPSLFTTPDHLPLCDDPRELELWLLPPPPLEPEDLDGDPLLLDGGAGCDCGGADGRLCEPRSTDGRDSRGADGRSGVTVWLGPTRRGSVLRVG